MSKKFWTSEKLIGFAALIVSLTTLTVFVYQTNLIRKQQYMSVYPHLTFTNYHSHSLNYKFVLKNNGVGPAFIKAINVEELNGKTYDSILEYVQKKLIEKDSVSIHNSDLFVGKLLPAGEDLILFGLSDESYTKPLGLPKNTVKGANTLRWVLNHDSLDLKVTYESIYGERWTISGSSQIPIKE